MNNFEPLILVIAGAIVFYLYRSHKRKVDYESVCEVAQVLRNLANRSESEANGKVDRHEVMADAIREAQAAVFAKRRLESDYANHVSRQLLSSFGPDFLESIGFSRETARFSRCRSGLFALAKDFERLQPRNKQW